MGFYINIKENKIMTFSGKYEEAETIKQSNSDSNRWMQPAF